MLKVLNRSDVEGALEVDLLLSDHDLCDSVKIRLAKGRSVMCCLDTESKLSIKDITDSGGSVHKLHESYTDFCWEDLSEHNRQDVNPKLLTVDSQCSLRLYGIDPHGRVSLVCVSSSDTLLESITAKHPDVSELRTVRLLSFMDGRCVLLMNACVVMHLRWMEESSHLDPLSSCQLGLPPQMQDECVDYHLCRGILFVLLGSGVTYVLDSTDGKLMATVDFPSYCGVGQTDADFSPPITFCLFQISHDLNTAMTVTCHNQALAVDLNDYFRMFPDHLCCRAAPNRPVIKPVESLDHDSLSSSAHSLSVLDTKLQTDRSWESRLSSLYSRSKAPERPAHRLPWYGDFPHMECHRASATAKLSQPSVKPGGAVMCFDVPEEATAAMLTVSKFSAVVTFVSPGNTVAYWDVEGESVTYHRIDTPGVPVQRSDEEHLCLLLKGSGLSAVLFCVTQEELLNRLMVFGTAGTVDSLCHLNAWGRCSIPIHALQAGLKNHQLDTVDFFLKSKENILSPTSGFVLPDQPSAVSSQTQLRNIHALCPALDLLRSAIQDTHTEAQSRQFCEQLLSITLTFLNTQTRVLLTGTHELDVHLQECVQILDGYVSDLRGYMKKFPWTDGGDAERPACPHTPTSDAATEREWQTLSDEEVVQRAVLSRQIPHAQAFLRRRGSVECSLEDVRKTGLRCVFTCLTRRDLQTAETLLANMGFNVKEQLHSICVHTADRVLRAFMVEELQSYLSPAEVQQVEFIKTIETLCSTPAMRCSNPLNSSRVLQITRSHPESRRLLEEIEQEPAQSSSRSLLDCVRLDWIRYWDTDAQSSVLLSRLQDSTLGLCDAVTLWSYLTSLHDSGRVTAWVCSMTAGDETTAAPRWPALTPHIINSHSRCGEYLQNQILDLLAPQGLFVQSEMGDFEQLLWRLGQAGGVMRDGSGPPVPQFLSSQGQEFHQRFILHCLENSLQYLLYTYLEHYRLTPGNCPVLDDKNLFESFPWFEMMLKLQRITRDLKDPERVFRASLTGAQVLLPGSQASISSMLLEGHSLLALSTIMFRPGGIDQAMREGERGHDPLSRVDPQLLRMALSAYPKLKTALFPQIGPRGGDISLYHLMQSLQPLDPSRLFGWQAGNVAGGTETSSEPPHFSSPHLVSRYALIENLDYLYYLSHGRPAFAYGVFLTQHLVNCSNVKLQLSQAVEQVFSLALLNFSSASVTAACVCFCELLGVCSLKLRVDLKALNLILKLWSRNCEDGAGASFRQTLVEKAGKLATDEKHTAQELVVHLEEAVRDALEKKGVSRSSYEAAQDWALPVKFCHLHALPLSSAYPQDCTCDGQWINFLLFVQLHSYPPQQVRSLAAGFSPALQAHISLAFQDLPTINSHLSLEEQGTVRDDSPEASRELFQVLLKSQEKASPWRYLLCEAVRHHSPALSVLAACHQGAELLQCLCVWILTSVEDEMSEEATAHIDENPSHHVWNLHDLSILWKSLLRRSKIRPLIRGFQLFQRESPLIYMLNMYELCYDYKDYQRAKDKLLQFQKCLLNLRSSSVVLSCDVLPVQWVESQASVLLLILLKQSRTQYELRRLLQLLVDMERLLKSNGPDFKKLSQLSQVLSDTPVLLSPCLLEDYSTSALQGECRKMLEQLQEMGLFTQARKVAQLAELPVDCLIINELLRDLSALKSKRQWDRQETRLGFWRKCHHQLKTDCVHPETACRFFLSQAEEPLQLDSEAIQLQESCLLLGLAGHWLSRRESPLPVLRLAQLEKRQWEYRIRWLDLRTALERESLFAPSALSEDSFENLLKEFSFSKMAVLNDQTHLSLEGLPASEDDCALSEQDRKALIALIGQLLNEGSVNEASRVCRYFGSFHRDVWLVLRCRGLACGELQPGLPELHSPDGESRRSLPSSPSMSSLSSFVVVSSPEDPVLIQLKQLVDQCCHGKSYCKQVLSLYELSKELQCTYAEISSEEPEAVLRKVLLSQQSDRCKKAQAFISVQGLRSDAVAQLISSAVVDGLLSSSQEGQTGERLMYGPVDSREEFIQLAKLCGDPNLVGTKLLEILSTVPLSELGCTVEILILAHDCFSLTCNMEGIVRVLQAARHLSHTHLAHGEGYGLLVRLLTGIGRYNDMTYIFDLLHQNHRFEMLLRKKVESNVRLKMALLDYIKRCLPGDSEKHNMVALCFSMCREIGENHEAAARTQLKIIESQPWAITGDLKNALVKALTLLKDAAESYSKDSCVRQAVKCVKMAKLVTLQLHFLNHGQELRVINLRPSELQSAIVSLPRCYQAFVLAEAYDYSPDWAEVLFQKIILNGEFSYLEEFKRHRSLPTSLFEEISKKMLHHKPPASSSQNLKKLLSHCEDVYMHYKLAYEHKFLDVANMLLQDSKTNSFLNDRLGT